MSETPEVSVVMSVYNGASSLAATMNSILSQEGVELELIAVNDGSIDQTGEILDDYARCDPRVRVIHQENTGLTRALIRGCGAARGEFIARQDAGDLALGGRLAAQRDVLKNDPSTVMTSCGTRYIGPSSEFLYEVCQYGDELQAGLKHVDVARFYGPSSHPSVMFRREAYERVGGYRAHFEVAQDLDLWVRLAELGMCWAMPEVLCEVYLTKNSISGLRRHEQLRSTKLILKCAEARRLGHDESQLIEKWVHKRRWRLFSWPIPHKLREAKFYYFIGSCLRYHEPKKSQLYYWQAVTTWFPYPRAWYWILLASGRRFSDLIRNHPRS